MKMSKYLLAVSIISLLTLACSDDEMDRTIFIPDEDNAQLPAYTEWGYNSFGAKYERAYFLASKRIVPCKITHQEGKLYFALCGYVSDKSESAYYYTPDKMTLTFAFPASPMDDYTDLLELHGIKIDLTTSNCTVTREDDSGNITDIVPIKGNLTFKRAQLLSIDGKVDRVILSGVFALQYLVNNRMESFRDGRFDVGMNDTDFYSIPAN
jgi:hypothetical protein